MVRVLGRQRVSGGFHVVEVASCIGLQVHARLVEVFTVVGVIVKILVEVDFPVCVEINEMGDLVASDNVNLLPDNFKSKRLVQPGGDTLPDERVQGIIESGDCPNIAVPCGKCSTIAVWEEVEPAET